MALPDMIFIDAPSNYVFFDLQEILDLALRFAFNFLVAYLIIRRIYYPIHKNKDYLFTYFLFNTIIFMLCYMMNNVQLQIGVAFGLFAIFSILRYRTMSVSIMDMAYLFLLISIAVINSLSNEKVSISEIIFANLIIVGIIYVLERLWLVKHASSKMIVYEKIENIRPENYEKLIADLKDRTGLEVHRVEIGRIDFMRDTARIKIFYFE
jgi:hypothetical protein